MHIAEFISETGNSFVKTRSNMNLGTAERINLDVTDKTSTNKCHFIYLPSLVHSCIGHVDPELLVLFTRLNGKLRQVSRPDEVPV